MTRKFVAHPLPRFSALAGLLFLASCARSAIDEVDEPDAFSAFEAGAEEEEDDAGEPEEDAYVQAVPEGGPPILYDAGPGRDAAPPSEDAGAPGDAGAMDAAKPIEAGAPEAGTPDAARDAAPDTSVADARVPDAAPPAPNCTAGNYKGTFTGTVDVVLFGIPLFDIKFTGEITLSAAADPAMPNRFVLHDGKIDGQDADGNKVTATVTGNVNCATGRVENGRLSGTYADIMFTGSVAGLYTNTPPSAIGTWVADQGASPFLSEGSGNWDMTRVP